MTLAFIFLAFAAGAAFGFGVGAIYADRRAMLRLARIRQLLRDQARRS